MTKIEQIQAAIHEANFFRSKLTPEALAVPGFTSLKIRHLMNNLGAISENYMEVGVHKGGTFCSAIFQNLNLTHATAIDNYSEFNEDSPMEDFFKNADKCKPAVTAVKLITKDCWTIDRSELPQHVDLYLYDGEHNFESQHKGVLHFLESMATEFILCVDDYSVWPQVKQGTTEAIALAGLRYKLKTGGFRVLFEQELWNGQEGDNFGWHNGFVVFLCSKV